MRKRVLWSKVTARSHKFDQISSELVHKRPGTPAELAEEYRANVCNSVFLAERGCLSRAESMRRPAPMSQRDPQTDKGAPESDSVTGSPWGIYGAFGSFRREPLGTPKTTKGPHTLGSGFRFFSVNMALLSATAGKQADDLQAANSRMKFCMRSDVALSSRFQRLMTTHRTPAKVKARPTPIIPAGCTPQSSCENRRGGHHAHLRTLLLHSPRVWGQRTFGCRRHTRG
jgi:hypothetical protein